MKFCKENLRKVYKEKREKLFKNGEISEISRLICEKLSKEDFFKVSKNILIFYPKGSELNPLGLLDIKKNDNKNFYLPRCDGNEILVCPYKEGDKLLLNDFKIYEPLSKPILDISILDIVITPALSCDIEFNRLGWGGGYYDRFFSKNTLKAKKVVILPHSLISEKLPSGSYDKKCDIIVTEKDIYYRERFIRDR